MNFFSFHIKIKLVFIISAFFLVYGSFSQGINIELGNPNIGLNEVFTITIVGNNQKISIYNDFPEIPGMVKRDKSRSTSTNIINGQVSFSQTTTQNYMAKRVGKYRLKPFTMEINGKNYKSDGITINVGPPRQVQRNPFDFNPFEDFFNDRNEPLEFVDVKADAFFGLTTNKDEVYVGEGVTVSLAFYVAAQNRAELDFDDIVNQHNEILKKLRPDNCWEENFDLERIEKATVVVNDRVYTQYKIYQGVFYPLSTQNIVFPPIDLRIKKYLRARGSSFFDVKEKIETFTSKKKIVKVKELPPHPLKEKVAVGNYKLEEQVSSLNLNTGESFNYDFKIVGEGNIAGLAEPEVPETNALAFYSPNVKQNIRRSGNKVTGSKLFSYHGIPNEPGAYPLDKYFSWIFFNPYTEKYDTLQSDLTIAVSGESKLNSSIVSSDLGSFYDQMGQVDDTLRKRDGTKWNEYLLNAFLVIMIVFTLVVIIKK